MITYLILSLALSSNTPPLACVLKTVCPVVHKTVHKKKPVTVIAHDSMCWEFPLTIIREPVTVPTPEVVPVAGAEPDMPTLNLPSDDTNVFADIGNTVTGWFDTGGSTGGGYIPHRGGGGITLAPELDPSAGMSAVLLLSGALAILRGKRS